MSVTGLLLTFIVIVCASVVRGSTIANGKLFENGTYAQVRGVNVIAMVRPGAPWAEAASRFLEQSKAIHLWYAPLPLSSWHVTVHPLFTERELPLAYAATERWHEIVDAVAPSLAQVMALLERSPVLIHPRYMELVPGLGVLAMRMALPAEEARAVSAFWKAMRNATARRKTDDLSAG
jgi:hypothetical protein